MFIKSYLSLVISSLLGMSLTAYADTSHPTANVKEPVECTDNQNYDQTDCQRAIERIQLIMNDEKLPDNKRHLYAVLGQDLLVEKATGFRIGLHKIINGERKKPSVAVEIGIPGKSQIFAISGVCDIGNSLEVVKNTPDFMLFNEECEATNRSGGRDNSFYYYNFDKRYKRLDVLLQNMDRQPKEPTQTYSKGLYKFLWNNYNNGSAKFSIYNDYIITGPREQDLKCIRYSDEDAGCTINYIAPLIPGKYKVVD
jgi:hypothetical protein